MTPILIHLVILNEFNASQPPLCCFKNCTLIIETQIILKIDNKQPRCNKPKCKVYFKQKCKIIKFIIAMTIIYCLQKWLF